MDDKKVMKYYYSFYDVSKDLNQKQFHDFNMAIYQVMFYEEHIDNIVFKDAIVSLIWKSVKHSLRASIDGYCGKKEIDYDNLFTTLSKGVVKGVDMGCENNSEPLSNNVNDNVNDNDKDKGLSSSMINSKLSEYTNININAFSEWVNHKKYKSIAPITKLLNMFTKYSHEDQQGMVDKAIMNGWKGLVEHKGQQHQQSQSFKQQDETREQEKSKAINRLLDAGFNPFSQADWDKLSEYEARLMQEHQGVIDVQPTQRIS